MLNSLKAAQRQPILNSSNSLARTQSSYSTSASWCLSSMPSRIPLPYSLRHTSPRLCQARSTFSSDGKQVRQSAAASAVCFSMHAPLLVNSHALSWGFRVSGLSADSCRDWWGAGAEGESLAYSTSAGTAQEEWGEVPSRLHVCLLPLRLPRGMLPPCRASAMRRRR